MGHASLVNMKNALERTSLSANKLNPFLVMSVSSKKCSIYRYKNQEITKIDRGPESITEVLNDVPEKVSNFSDQSARLPLLREE